ncbi:MAG: AAA family ATPase, partial [Xenococcaceae cyanobacterium MO_234.B1]|nr:AAA family ATPase [Xenococcaceae cyanobacterium MO_234.B1]
FDTIRFNPGGKLPDREELKAKLKQKVIGQEAAIDTLVRMVMGKLAAKNSKPLVVFLPGPTGTGKTELSKALAEALETKLTRFDMGEYAESHKASNLFGSPKGYVGSTDGGALPNALRQSKKRCVLLFDEVEKAHSSLWRQMLAFFDEGRVSDTIGQTLAPKNTICLLTSNIEADKIADNPESAKDIIKQCGYFPPEFLGRIDKVIPLLRLGEADTARLTVVLAKKVASEFDISLIIEQEALEHLVNVTFDEAQKYGGRGIMEKVKDLIADDLVDLQGNSIFQARLVVKENQLRAVPLLVKAN